MDDSALSADLLDGMLGECWRARRPRYRALAERLRELIGRGEIAQGMRLPPERELACALGVGRGTIVAAYDALRDADVLQRRQGSGTFVGDANRRWTLPSPVAPGAVDAGLVSLTIPRPEPLQQLLTEAMVAGAAEVAEAAQGLDELPEGLPALRTAVADSFTRRGLPTERGQIRIADSPSAALALALGRLVEPGARVLVESPAVESTLESLRALQLRLVTVPAERGRDGADEVAAAVRRGRPDAMLLMPSCHPIVGRVASQAERVALGRLGAEEGIGVIDHDMWAGLTLDDDPAAPLAAFTQGPRVVTVGSANSWFGGIQLSWVRYHEPLVPDHGRLHSGRGQGTSVVTQLVVNQLLHHHADVVQRRRREMADRLDLAVELLAGELPEWSWQYPRGGRSLWLRLPRGDAADLARVALRHGVAVLPGPMFSPDGGHRDRVRIFFVQPRDVLGAGLRRLGRAWAEYAQTIRGVPVRGVSAASNRSA
jgi:DNA-binding transcriptional MocR family regulator